MVAQGICGGRERYIINHVTRMSPDIRPALAEHWKQCGYRVEIDSYPPVRVDWPMGLPNGGGTAFADAMIMTAARCVNSVEAVVQASPGYKLFPDLAPVGGKYALKP